MLRIFDCVRATGLCKSVCYRKQGCSCKAVPATDASSGIVISMCSIFLCVKASKPDTFALDSYKGSVLSPGLLM